MKVERILAQFQGGARYGRIVEDAGLLFFLGSKSLTGFELWIFPR